MPKPTRKCRIKAKLLSVAFKASHHLTRFYLSRHSPTWMSDVRCTGPFIGLNASGDSILWGPCPRIPQSTMSVFPSLFKSYLLFKLDSSPNSTRPFLVPLPRSDHALLGSRILEEEHSLDPVIRLQYWWVHSGWCVENSLGGGEGEQKQNTVWMSRAGK